MQATSSKSPSNHNPLRFGLPVENVQDSLSFIHSQFELEWRAPFNSGNFLEIRLGRDTDNVDIANLSGYLRSRRLVPRWDGVSITADNIAWKSTWETVIQGRLPRVVTTIVTLYDSDKGIQETTLKYDDQDSYPLTSRFAIIPVNKLQADDAAGIFRLPGLQTLILLPPQKPFTFRANIQGITQILIDSLPMAASLRKVSLTLDFSTGIKQIIEALKNIPSLTTLELTKPTSFDISILNPARRIELDNVLLRSLEPFPGLEKLVLDGTILSLPLLDMGGRMFGEKITSSKGRSVIFQSPLPLLFQGVPSFLL